MSSLFCSRDPAIKLPIAMILRKFMQYFVKNDRKEANFLTPNFPMQKIKKIDKEMK